MRSRLVLLAAGGITAAAVVTGVIISHGASAQQPSPTATPGAGRQQAQQRMDDYLNRLAQNLGISVDKLKDGIKQTSLQEVDQALAAGRITQQQADRLKEAINAGNIPGFGFGPRGFGPGGPGGPGPGAGFGRGFDVGRDKLAGFLGITADQLRTELNGKSLAQVAQDHGKTRDQLKQFIIDTATADLASAVQNGRLTQQQSDRILQAMKDHIDQMIDHVRGSGMPGMPGMPGRRGR